MTSLNPESNPMKTLLRFVASVGILLGQPAIASMVEYTVDTSASFVTVSGTFEGIPLSEQTPGSSTAHYGGNFLGNLENGLLALEGNNTVSLFQPIPALTGFAWRHRLPVRCSSRLAASVFT